jgi:hypothetical protein
MVNRDAVVREAAESEFPRMFGTVAVILSIILLAQVLTDLRAYQTPTVAVAVWLGMIGAAAWLVPRARAAGGLTGIQAAGAITIAITAVVLIGWDRRTQGAAGTPDWSIIGTVWLLALVALSRRARMWVSGALLIFAAHAVFVIDVPDVTALTVARLAAAGYIMAVILAVLAALRPALRTNAALAARRAALASRSAAERAAAAAVREDRRERRALLEMEALPLLRGIADGTLDPADRAVRELCARHAATLRQALTDRVPNTGHLLAELDPALRAARARGLHVEVQAVGDPGSPVREVAGATLAAVDAVMSALPPHQVLLTILGCGDDAELYLIFDRPLRAVPDVTAIRRQVPAAARWDAAVGVDDSGAGCLEVRWCKAEPA